MNAPRVILVLLAVAWVALGVTTTTVVLEGTRTSWVLGTGLVAGASLAMLHYRTRYAFGAYVILVCLVGIVRSVMYLADGVRPPAAVWAIVSLTTVLAYVEMEDRWN